MNSTEANVSAELAIAIKDELASYVVSDQFLARYPDLNVLTMILAVTCLLSEIIGQEDNAAENKKFVNKFLAPLMCATFDPPGTPLDLAH